MLCRSSVFFSHFSSAFIFINRLNNCGQSDRTPKPLFYIGFKCSTIIDFVALRVSVCIRFWYSSLHKIEAERTPCNISQIQICMIKHFDQKIYPRGSIYNRWFTNTLSSFLLSHEHCLHSCIAVDVKNLCKRDVIVPSNSFNCSPVMYVLQKMMLYFC